MFRNGTLVGKNTVIKNYGSSQLFSSVVLSGTWNAEVGYPEWFGAVGDGQSDDREAIQAAIVFCKTVVLEKNSLIYNAPFDFSKYNPIPDNELSYFKDVLAQKNSCSNSKLTPLVIPSGKKMVVKGSIKAYSPLGNLIEIRGDNTVINGGGTISGCGIVSSVNVYSGKPKYTVTDWEAALIYIKGSKNKVENLTIKDPSKQGISIDDYLSKDNVICDNIIGGGLLAHTEDIQTCDFSRLFGIYARGTNTVIRNNVFKRIEGRAVYDALYCDYTTLNVPDIDKRTDIHTTFDNNIVEDALEHAVYSYASNLRVIDNTLYSDNTVLQLFNGKQFLNNNILHCNEGSLGIYVSGESQIITNNKIYNVGKYGIRCTGYYNGSCDNDYVADNYIEKLMVPFSDSQPQTTPAITFESTAFRENKLHLNKITCERNTILCKGESKAARTIPIVGIIAVYGDANSTFEQITIKNNTVLNSNVADNIGVTLENEEKRGVLIVEGNKCINDCPIISTTPSEPVMMIKGVNRAIVRGNHFEQTGDLGTAFELSDVKETEFTGNTLIANLNSTSLFYYTNKGISIYMDGSNIVNGRAVEQIVTFPAKSTSPITVYFSLPHNHWDLEITPLNTYAKSAEKHNPLQIIDSNNNGVQLSHLAATKHPTKYKIRVIYK